MHAHAGLLSCSQKAGPHFGIKLVLCQIQYRKLVRVVPNVAGRGVPKSGSEQTVIKVIGFDAWIGLELTCD